MKQIYLYTLTAILLLVAYPITLIAETKSDYTLRPHEIRIGWGDQLFETLIWHTPTHIVNTYSESYQKDYNENHRYNQHLWIEYQKRHNYWFSYGAMVDMSSVLWDKVNRNGKGVELSRSNAYFYNVVCMPTIRFTYFHHPNVNLYSGLGAGFCINGGSEKNYRIGRYTDIGWAAYICLLGISANYDRWCWSLDLGGLYAMRDMNTVFLASSRMISIGLGVRF